MMRMTRLECTAVQFAKMLSTELSIKYIYKEIQADEIIGT